MRHRTFSLSLFVMAASALVFAQQVTLPSLLATHAKSMTESVSLTGTATVQPLPGEPATVSFWFSKPDKFRIETPDKTWVCDGKTLTTYEKSTNSYSVTPVESPVPGATEAWAWASFFEKEPYKYVQSAKAGNKRTVKGHKVTEVSVSWKSGGESTGTMYIDDAGMCWGFDLKSGDKETLVLAEQVTKGDAPIEDAKFAFTVPANAVKAETLPKATFNAVKTVFQRNCMPCHSSNQQSGGVDLTSYETLMQANIVTPSKPEESQLYKVISGPRPTMPKNRSKLQEADVKTVGDWIKEGAKNS